MRCRRRAVPGTMRWWRSATPEMKARLPVWLAALWWCSLSTIGFLVVPMLFAHLPQAATAGGLAARLFTAQTWVSCVCATLLLVLSRSNLRAHAAPMQEIVLFVVGAMLLALLSEFAVAPRILARENLRVWHSMGSAMYVLQWLCAGATLWKLTASNPQKGPPNVCKACDPQA